MMQIDNHNPERVTWMEFTDFLKKAGEWKSIANNGAITKFGFTRAKQEGRSKVFKEDQEQIIDFNIEKLFLIDMGHSSVHAFVVFENWETCIFNISNFSVKYRFKFQSTYTVPKSKRKTSKFKSIVVNNLIDKCTTFLNEDTTIETDSRAPKSKS